MTIILMSEDAFLNIPVLPVGLDTSLQRSAPRLDFGVSHRFWYSASLSVLLFTRRANKGSNIVSAQLQCRIL